MPGRTKKDEPTAQDTNMEDAPPSAQPEAEEVDNEDQEEAPEEEEIEPQRVRIVRPICSISTNSALLANLDSSSRDLQTLLPHLSSSMRDTQSAMR